jgi:hypothetical protein
MLQDMNLLEFQAIWSSMRYHPKRQNPNHFDFHCSFFDAHLLKELVSDTQIEEFAAKLYAQGLMVQVAHSASRHSPFFLSSSQEKENTFPRVNGILSTMHRHVCPAVLPSMLLYLEPSLVVGDDEDRYSMRSRELEQALWISKSEVFDNAVEKLLHGYDVLTNLLFCELGTYLEFYKDFPNTYLFRMFDSGDNETLTESYSRFMDWLDSRELYQKILREHLQLKEFIVARDDSQRVVNLQS